MSSIGVFTCEVPDDGDSTMPFTATITEEVSVVGEVDIIHILLCWQFTLDNTIAE